MARTRAGVVVLLAFVAAGIATGAYAWGHHTADVPGAAAAAPLPTNSGSTVRPDSDSPPIPGRRTTSVSGKSLAGAWLRGFLTRSDRNDPRWESAIASLSDPDLVAQLRAQGPDSIGLTALTSWRVTKISPIKAYDRPVDTPTRTVLAYAATVTDGTTTLAKPFVLTAYRTDRGQPWLVSMVEQPYSSEG